MSKLEKLDADGWVLLNPDAKKYVEDMELCLKRFLLLLPSPEGLVGHAPIGAFVEAGHIARKLLKENTDSFVSIKK